MLEVRLSLRSEGRSNTKTSKERPAVHHSCVRRGRDEVRQKLAGSERPGDGGVRGGGEGRDNQGQDRVLENPVHRVLENPVAQGREGGGKTKRTVTLRSISARGGGGIGLKRGGEKLPTHLRTLLIQELKHVKDVRMDARQDILVDHVLGRVDRAKSIEVILSVTPTPSSKSIGLPIALAVLRGDDPSGDILECGVRFNLESIGAMGSSGNEVLLNKLPEVPIWP